MNEVCIHSEVTFELYWICIQNFLTVYADSEHNNPFNDFILRLAGYILNRICSTAGI